MIIDQIELNKYNTAAEICGQVYKYILDLIDKKNIRDIRTLCEMGNKLIIEKLNLVFKKIKNKSIAFPVCISLNDCVSYYIYEESNDMYNTIKDTDVIKIEFGVNIDNCIARFGETVVVGELTKEQTKFFNSRIKLLNKLQNVIISQFHDKNTNDEVRIEIEKRCSEKGCFPMENCISFQHTELQFQTEESKYMILNYTPYYDEEDCLVTFPNNCFEFCKDEVYTIELRIVDDDDSLDNQNNKKSEHIYTEPHLPHVYRYNGYHYDLKSKHSRKFITNVINTHGTNAFDIRDYRTDVKNRIGIKEANDNGILQDYSILYNKAKKNVYLKIFTIIVKDTDAYILKYT